jgi:hypothetical protein
MPIPDAVIRQIRDPPFEPRYLFYLSMIFSENRRPPRIKCGAGFFRIMLY